MTTEIEQAVGPEVGRVQTDTFCAGCGYNLYTQAVVRDRTLGLLVCRCPECGRYTAAGQTTTASRVWLNRLATMLLTAWVFCLLGLFGFCTLFLAILDYGHTREMTQIHYTSGPGATVYRCEVKQIPADDVIGRYEALVEQIWLGFLATALALVVGVLFSALLWHCKGWPRLLAFGPPVVACAFLMCQWVVDPEMIYIRGWGLEQFGLYLGMECVAVAIGLLIGRPVARGIVRITVPPRARQHLSFLWLVDGKTLKPE